MSKNDSIIVDSGTHAGIHVPAGDFCNIIVTIIGRELEAGKFPLEGHAKIFI